MITSPSFKSSSISDIWTSLREEAGAFHANPTLDSYVSGLMALGSLGVSLARLVADQITGPVMDAGALFHMMQDVLHRHPLLEDSFAQDLAAVMVRDPAADGLLRPLLFFKGYQAIQLHRIAHALWKEGNKDLALYLQYRGSVVFGVDVHPAARLGHGIMLDHATGLVVGETAIIEDDVSILHGVTLGGTGKEKGDRHPKVRKGVMIGASATILGNIEIGEGACIAAGSMVLKPVPAHMTVAGVPAEVVGQSKCETPSAEMDQTLPEKEKRLSKVG